MKRGGMAVKDPKFFYYTVDYRGEDRLDEDVEKELQDTAYSLCPYEHRKDSPCIFCKKTFQALEKAYKDGCEACY